MGMKALVGVRIPLGNFWMLCLKLAIGVLRMRNILRGL